MIDYSSSKEDILLDLLSDSIDCSLPGFYDDPNFLKNEKINNRFLNNYARFVDTQEYTTHYLDYAEKAIEIVGKELHDQLAKDGRLGACIDMSMIYSRILERHGVWNYIVKGALTINYPPQYSIPTSYFWPVDNNDAKAGHVWIVAPPFRVVDITLKLQPYTNKKIPQILPDIVLAKDGSSTNIEPIDIVARHVQRDLTMFQGVKQGQMIATVNPELPKFFNVFPPLKVNQLGVEMKYIRCAISASDEPLEEIKSLTLSGKFGIEVYNDVIEPVLKDKGLDRVRG